MLKRTLKKKINKIAIFISDEGFGHSVRQKTIIAELFRQNKNAKVTIFNKKRLLFLKEYYGNKLEYFSYPITLNTIKNKKGELDIIKTKKILKNWPKVSSISIKKLLKK